MRKLFAFAVLGLFLLSCKKSVIPPAPEPITPQPDKLPPKQAMKKALEFPGDTTPFIADPVTFSMGANNANATIKGATVNASDTFKLTYYNVRTIIPAGPSFPRNYFYVGQAADYGTFFNIGKINNMMSVGFMFSGTEFEIRLLGSGSPGNIFIEIDGKITNKTGYTAPPTTDGGLYYCKVSISNQLSGSHKIKIILPSDRPIEEIVTASGSYINKIQEKVLMTSVFIGDSFTVGSNATSTVNCYAFKTGKVLGWTNNILSGVEGSGYLNPSIGNKTFRQRLQDIVNAIPDVVVIAGGLNDIGTYSADQVGAEALMYLQAIRSALPSTEIIVIGPWWLHPNYPLAYATAIQNATKQVSETYFIDNSSWVTGSGNVSNPKGDGNADWIVSADNTTPTDAGHAYLAQKLIQQIQSVITNF